MTGPTPFDYHEQFEKYSKLDPEDIEDWKEDDPDQYTAYEEAKKLAEANPMSESAIRARCCSSARSPTALPATSAESVG